MLMGHTHAKNNNTTVNFPVKNNVSPEAISSTTGPKLTVAVFVFIYQPRRANTAPTCIKSFLVTEINSLFCWVKLKMLFAGYRCIAFKMYYNVFKTISNIKLAKLNLSILQRNKNII